MEGKFADEDGASLSGSGRSEAGRGGGGGGSGGGSGRLGSNSLQGSSGGGDDSSTVHTPTNSSTTWTSQSGFLSGRRRGGRDGIPDDILTGKETRAVKYSRILVLSVLVISAALTGSMTWYLTAQSEQENFETQFRDFAFEIEDVSYHNAYNVFRVSDSFSTSITSFVLSTHTNIFNEGATTGRTSTSSSTSSGRNKVIHWPNVTIPHFEIRGEKYRQVVNAQLVSFSPLVSASKLQEWNAYSVSNQGWIRDAYLLRDDDESTPNPIPSQIYRRVYQGDNSTIVVAEDGTNEKDYMPLWQESEAPADTSVINYNLLSDPTFHRVFNLARDTQKPVLSEVFDPSTLLGKGALKEFDDNQIHPESILVQPVFDTFVNDDSTSTRANVVGALISVIPWDTYFRNLLHEGAQGILCVLRDTCEDEFTYRIDGPMAEYIGIGDRHASKYDDLVHIVPFAAPEDYAHDDDDLSDKHCDYSLHIYPTEELEKSYYTKRPLIYTIIVVLIFVFTSMVFVLYDFLVQRRQEKVHSAAVKSNAIVSSLFPAEVRDRLFQYDESAPEQNPKNHGDHGDGSNGGPGGANSKSTAYDSTPKFRLKNYLDGSRNNTSTDDTASATTSGRKRRGSGAAPESATPSSEFVPEMYETKPIADLFPNTTVMFADIAGFTAWSSVREPSQVFTLLETVYRAFDMIAKKRRVFKVETVGDCYVAVTGLPEPRKDHAVVMARFARDCMKRMNELTHQLEVTLGPDTGDLAMRFGLHSGPVTAGVLRGDKSRFQLFGDTVNTAARIESTGMKNRIHLSQETADLLKHGGKESWMVPRTDVVVAKGKGEMKTFWLLPREGSNLSEFKSTHGLLPDSHISDNDTNNHNNNNNEASKTSLGISSIQANGIPTMPQSTFPPMTEANPKIKRLVEWNVDVLKRILKQILAKRVAMAQNNTRASTSNKNNNPTTVSASLKGGSAQVDDVVSVEQSILNKTTTCLHEVVEVIALPQYDANVQRNAINPNLVQINPIVEHQLRSYIESIACQYRENPFHNFEHASHVTMSVSKLLSRIVAPDIDILAKDFSHNLHDHTYGITSDPLTQFAVVLSALIHDVDHVGVPNMLLLSENKTMANRYRNKSVAEQNSVDLAWQTLMEPKYSDLRRALYTDTNELHRFRKLVVNSVLATDIFDRELSTLRRSRWEKAFTTHSGPRNEQEDVDRKATIVIEHLIQASDVAHTMQHWHIYQKWNERLFLEMYTAYNVGRSSKDPSYGWYQGELGFFDNYVIPLAKKLKECGVFGVSSDEYLNYALENRREWAAKGEEVVAAMTIKYGKKFQDGASSSDFSGPRVGLDTSTRHDAIIRRNIDDGSRSGGSTFRPEFGTSEKSDAKSDASSFATSRS